MGAISKSIKTHTKRLVCLSVALSFFSSLIYQDVLLALPLNYTVEAGEVSFENLDENSLIIHASDRAILNFDSFSILANESVRFVQPNETSSDRKSVV